MSVGIRIFIVACCITLISCSIGVKKSTEVYTREGFTIQQLNNRKVIVVNRENPDAEDFQERHDKKFKSSDDFYAFYYERLLQTLGQTNPAIGLVSGGRSGGDTVAEVTELIDGRDNQSTELLEQMDVAYILVIDSMQLSSRSGFSYANQNVHSPNSGPAMDSGGPGETSSCNGAAYISIWSVAERTREQELIIHSSRENASGFVMFDKDYEACIRKNADELAGYLRLKN